MSLHTTRLRQVALLTIVSLAVSAGCATSPDVRPTTPPDVSTVAPFAVSLPVALLASRLDLFLTAAARGEPVDQRLAGDRLLVLTAATFSELPATALAGDAREVELSFGYGCPGVCMISFGSLLELLITDLDAGEYATAPSPPADALAQWPSLSFRGAERSWRVSFDDNGERIVAFEVFGPLTAD